MVRVGDLAYHRSMRRLGLVAALALLGCGPPSPTLEDGLGDDAESTDGSSESSTGDTEIDTSGTGNTETESSSTDTDSSSTDTDSSSTDSSDTDEDCPTEILGMLEIDDQSDLSAFACLEEAQWVYIEGSFSDLSFLSTLTTVEVLNLRNLPNLTSLESLASLQQIQELWLRELPALTDLGGLRDDVEMLRLRVGPGTGLQSLAMPPGGSQVLTLYSWDRSDLSILTTTAPPLRALDISSAPLVTDLSPIADCCLAQAPEFSLTLAGALGATALEGLEPFTILHEFELYDSGTVNALTGLQNLSTVEVIQIKTDCSPDAVVSPLVDLHGLEGLTTVVWLNIEELELLTSLAGLPTGGAAFDSVSFYGNATLDKALIDAWQATVTIGNLQSCDNLNDQPCEGFCPQ